VHARQPKQTLSLILGGLVLSLPVPSAFAQVATALTPSGLNTQVSGPTVLPSGQVNYDITGGTRPGTGVNLFHSFGDFSVASNSVANFLNNTNLPTTNILGRVTGGNPSNIFGTVQTTGFGNANLFLINPAGVVFGPTASLNVGGSVHVSTANYVILADGTRFNAVQGAQDALLTSAPIEAFGFLGAGLPSGQAGMITVQPEATLTVPTGQTISFVGRDNPSGDGQTAGVAIIGGTVEAEAGRINLVSVGKPQSPKMGGEVNVTDGSLSASSGFKSLGTVLVKDGATLSASTSGVNSGLAGGTVVIRAGRLMVENSSVTVDGVGRTSETVADGGTIDVYAATVTLDRATMSANSDRNNAGQIRFMDLETLSITNSDLTANARGLLLDGGFRGSVSIGTPTTRSISLSSTGISTTMEGFNGFTHPGVDNQGISLTAKTMSIDGGSLRASAGPHDIRPGGPITINGERITVTNQASLESRDTSGGGGAGTILLQGLLSDATTPTHAKQVTVDNSTLRTTSTGGPGGTITLHADKVILNNAALGAGSGNKGGTLNLGDVGRLESANSILDASTFAGGSGGMIILGSPATKSITLQDTTLSVRATGFNVQNGGTINIMASQHFKSIGSTFDASSTLGNGGSVLIQAGHLSLIGSTVNALGAGPGQDGTIQFEFGKKLVMQESVVAPDATIVSGWQAP